MAASPSRRATPGDNRHLLPHLRPTSSTSALRVAAVTFEANGATYAAAGGDAVRLRGLPAVSKSSIGSAIPGTQPEQALLKKYAD